MFFETYYFPLEPPDLNALEKMVRLADPFTPSFVPDDPADVYRTLAYRREQNHHGTDTVLLVDRNLVSRWIGTAQRRPVTDSHRTAAAVMAFAHCANIMIEPNLALYEVASSLGSAVANAELSTFRTADNIAADEWTRFALGRCAAISVEHLERARNMAPISPAPVDFEMPLRRWRRNYVLALKIARLELEGGKSHERMEALLCWMYSDFLIGGPAVALAAHYLAPNASRGGLIHGLRSPDRTRALDGIRNVAWDLTILSEWTRRVAEQEDTNRLTLLASLDRGLQGLARSLTDQSLTDSPGSLPSARLFEGLWGKSLGRPLAELLQHFEARSTDVSRQLHREAPQDFIRNLIQEGEAVVRSWRAR